MGCRSGARGPGRGVRGGGGGPGRGVRVGGEGARPWGAGRGLGGPAVVPQLSQAGPVSAPLPTVITTLILQPGASTVTLWVNLSGFSMILGVSVAREVGGGVWTR